MVTEWLSERMLTACGSPVAAQVSFWTVQALMDVKRELAPAVRRNRAREATTTAYAAFDADGRAGASRLQVRQTLIYTMQPTRALACTAAKTRAPGQAAHAPKGCHTCSATMSAVTRPHFRIRRMSLL